MSKEWDAVRESYKLLEVIGDGAAGIVLKAIHRTSKTIVAIKYLKVSYKEEEQYVLKKLLREL